MTNIDISPEDVERLIISFEEFCLNEGIRLECVSEERETLRALSAALTKSRAETAAAYERAAAIAQWVAGDACDTPDEMRGAAMVEYAILAAIPKGGDA